MDFHEFIFEISELCSHYQCYDDYNERGESVRASDYIRDLAYHNMDNRINSCCITGTDQTQVISC